MSKDRRDDGRHVGCGVRTAYGTREAAEHSADVRSRRYGVELEVYRCRSCGDWHITTVRQ